MIISKAQHSKHSATTIFYIIAVCQMCHRLGLLITQFTSTITASFSTSVTVCLHYFDYQLRFLERRNGNLECLPSSAYNGVRTYADTGKLQFRTEKLTLNRSNKLWVSNGWVTHEFPWIKEGSMGWYRQLDGFSMFLGWEWVRYILFLIHFFKKMNKNIQHMDD